MTPAISPLATAGAAPSPGREFSSLGQKDFIRLMTVQMQQQDPFDPVDNKQMLAQMAQFSTLAGIDDVNTTLQTIAEKLDALSFAQGASTSATDAAADDTSGDDTTDTNAST